MLITSLRDLTSTVTVEALALGLPVVCPNHCGFEAVIDETCGLKIAVRTPRQFIAEMGLALERLARDEALRRSLGLGALKRAEAFAWAEKATCVDAVYQAAGSGAMPGSSM
jgi:glycosyltransferase involved in cell wall biosynthesis